MIYLSVFLGLFIACILCVFAGIIYTKWKSFHDLKKGDTCYVETKPNVFDSPLKSEEIIKIDEDASGYTKKIYTNDGSYDFIDFLKNNVRISDDF